ncbi:MAG: C39 family peptidase, partial [Phototrophicaceae bacterium]
MSENKPKPSNHPTEPLDYEEIAPPPSILRWFVFATLLFLVLLVLGIIGGGWAFREVVPPRYQVYYSDQFPILKVLLPPRPANDAVLPTPIPQENSISLEELLGAPLQTPTMGGQTPEQVATLPPTQIATATPTTTPTPLPTATSLPPTATTDASAFSGVQLVSSVPAKARNHGFTYTKQTWNNCGPANVTMSLSYFGWLEDQSYAQNYLRGNREDKNVSPHEIEAFVNSQTGVNAAYRIGGSVELLKQLIAGGFPVMIELGYAPEGNDWLGHYQTLVGYDDSIGSFYVMDTYIPSTDGLAVPYLELDRNWQAFNRTLIVYFTDEQETTVKSLLGDLATAEGGYQKALETAQREA